MALSGVVYSNLFMQRPGQRPRQIVISCLLAVLVVDFTLCQVGKRKIKVFCEVKLIGILQISFRNL